MRKNLHQSRFQGIARAMTRNYGVRVVFAGTCPKTDGRTIYLPANADLLPGHDQESLEGWVDHESCHVEEEIEAERNGTTSPMALMNGAAKRKGPAAQLMLNVYEDVRIENHKSATHPGVAENLRMVNERSIQRYIQGSTGDAWQDITGAIIATGRDLDTSWIKDGVKVVIDLIQDELAEMSSMTTPDDALALAIRTVDKIHNLLPEAQKEQKQREQGGDEGDEDQDGEGDGSDNSPSDAEGDEDADNKDAEGEGQGEDGGTEDGNEDAEGDDECDAGGGAGDDDDSDAAGDDAAGDDADGSGQADSVQDLSDDDLDELVKTLAEARNEPDITDFVQYTEQSITIEAVQDVEQNLRVIAPPPVAACDGFVSAPKGELDDYQEAKADVNDQIGTLKRKLSTALRAQQQVHFVGDKEDGRLDPATLYAIKAGERRVFAQQTKATAIDTVITLLIDLSGSMGSSKTNRSKKGRVSSRQNRAWYAKRTAVALAETLNSIGVPFEVLGFHNQGYISHRDRRRFMDTHKGANRWGPFKITPFKLFNEALRRCRARFAVMDGRGCNGDGDAVMFAAQRLATRPETRKLLIVISDGQPAGAAPAVALEADLRRVIKLVTNSGIEVYGIGAKNHAVADYYNEDNGASHIIIDDLTKLATSVFKLIRSKLLRRIAA